MRKFYILFILIGFICTKNQAQTISGIITDKASSEELIGVNIILENGNGTATDVFGKYTLKTTVGIQKITFKYIGYEDIVKEVTVRSGENKVLNTALKPASELVSTVVISAGRFEQKIEEITVSMEVIKPSLIENKNTTNIQTAMDQIPGVNITDGQANIRGGSGWSYGAGTRVLVLVDDMPLISGDAGQVQWNLIATENINQVEIIKGAASALYGSSALNGIINIRTAFPSQKDINKNSLPGYTKVNMHFGLIDFAKRRSLNWNGMEKGELSRRSFKGIEFLQSMKLNNLDLSLGGNFLLDDGYRMGEVTDRKRFNINSTYKSKKIEGLSYGVNANFLFQSTGSAIIWHNLDSAYTPLDGEVTTTNGDTYNIDPSITYIKGTNRHSLKTRYLKVINDNNTKGVDNGQDNESEVYYSDYQWQKNHEEYGLRVTVGTTNEMVYVRSDLFNGKSNRINNSLYTQLDKKHGRLNISLGARYENFKLTSNEKYFMEGDSINTFSAGRPIFRTGLNYQLAEATYVRGSWGQGYRFPSMAELFISTEIAKDIWVYPNASLNPENGWSAELGLKQGLKVGNWRGYLDVAGFLMQYDDMMEFTFAKWEDGDGLDGVGFKSVNIGKTQISGVELSVSGGGKITNDITMNILAGYTYMDPISLKPDDVYITAFNGNNLTYNSSSSDASVLKYRYKHIAKIDTELIYKKLSLGGSFRYNDFMKNIDAIFADEIFFSSLVPGISPARENGKDGDIIIDTRLGYQFNDMIRFGFVINNLLNREYMNRPANMMPPRTFAMQLAFKI